MLRMVVSGLLVLVNMASYGQWADDFTDGNFTLAPEWSGETEKFEIADEVLHLNDAAASGSAYLSTPSKAVADATWKFSIKISENPSSSNFTRIYLMADQADVSGPLNGYFVMVGGTEDEVSLYRQDGSSVVRIIDGEDKRVDSKPVQINIQVTRDNQGNWELLSQPLGEPSFVREGNVQDERHTVSHYAGLLCRYTSTRKDAFYFDNFEVTGVPQPDTAPPTVVDLSVLSATQLQLTFSEALDGISSQTLSHYELSSQPVSAIQAPDAQTIVLTWNEPLTNGSSHTLQISSIQDEAGNVLVDTTLHLHYFVAVDAQWQDIVINEWMPDPNPVVSNLPEAEFIELYNRSPHPFQLQRWTLNDKQLPEYLLLPGRYVVLFPANQVTDFARYGDDALPLTSWLTLPNGGGTLTLEDADGGTIDSLEYTESLVEGGYSIERLRRDHPCDQRLNYGISLATDGGTPGEQNSLIEQPDTQAPTLQHAIASSSREVQIHFDEAIIATDAEISLTPKVNLLHKQADSVDEKVLVLRLSEDLLSNTTYIVTVNHARDCYGNEASPITTHFYYDDQPPAIKRVLVRDTASLLIDFNEPLGLIGDKNTYYVSDIGAANSVQWLNDSASVIAHFSTSFDHHSTHQLAISGATDRYGNRADSLVYNFAFRNDIDTVWAASGYQINVVFAAAPLSTIAQTVENYHINRGIEYPNVAVTLSPTEVQLIYDRPLSANKEYELQTENLVSTDGTYLSTPIYRFTYDQKAPSLDSVVAIDERTLIAYFNEKMVWDTAPSATAFSVNQNIGPPQRVELLPGGQSFKLYLSNHLTQETTYQLSVVGLADYSGNAIASTKKKEFLFDQQPPSVRHGRLVSPDQVLLEFHEPVDTALARNPRHYTLLPDVYPDSVAVSTVHPERVTLFFTHPLPKAVAIVQVVQLADHYQNTLKAPVKVAIDNRYPALGNVVPLSATELRLDFTRSVDATVMTQVANYRLDSLTQPIRAVVGADNTSVTLSWSASLVAGSEHTVSVRHLTDQTGTTSEAVESTFTYDTKVVNVITDDSGLTVEFNVPVDAATATDASHYSVTEIGVPVAAILINSRTVRLVFAQPFAERSIHTLTLTGLLDVDHHVIPASQHIIGQGLAPRYHQLLITEVMADPLPAVGLPEVEYVELYNASDQPINTLGVQFSDASTTAVLPSTLLAPHEYIILTDADHQAALSRYGRTIAVGTLPSLNSSGDSLHLADAYGQEVFSVVYSDDWYNDAEKRKGGWSLEMFDTQRPCGEQDNWTASVDPAGGTPGQENSVQQANPDQFGPTVLRAWAVSDTIVRIAFSEKIDAPSTRSAQLRFSYELMAQSVRWAPTRKEAIVTLNHPLQTKQHYSVSVEGVTDCSGNLIDKVSNTATFVLPEPATHGDILLSELLFRPRSGGEKFIELYNHSTKQIDLKDWYLGNITGDSLVNKVGITGSQYVLAPGEYVALTEDPTTLKADYPAAPINHLLRVPALPSLPTEEGEVVLLGPAQEVMQQFHYADRYHHPLLDDTRGIALERVSWESQIDELTAWQSAAKTVGYATPGYRNSQYANVPASLATLKVDPPVFSPNHVGRPHYTRIHYRFGQPGMVANVTIYDAQGREVRDLARNTTLAKEGFLTWDGTNDSHRRVSTGYFLIFFEVFDTQGRVNVFKDKVVVGGF